MLNKKHIITVPLIVLLLLSCYFVYFNINIFSMNLYSILFLVTSFCGAVLSSIALYVHLAESNKTSLFNDLARHIEGQYTSAHSISKNRVMKDKLAYEYVKSNFDSLCNEESKIRSEHTVLKSFLNNFAYEIRTPMNAIFGYTKLLKETTLNPEQKDLINIIESSFENLDSTLGKMSLDLSVHSPKIETKDEPFNIVKEVETAVETFSVQADQKDIVLGLYIDPQISHNLLGDGDKLAQVLTHLIDNALEVSEAYSTVDIKLEEISVDSVNDDMIDIKFSILDQATGIEDEELESIRKIFRDMEIVDKSSTLDIRNLTISNRIIKRMGGTLDIVSRKNEGSSFSFILTFKKDNEEVDRKLNPVFKGLKIGLALPHKDIKRQVDYNLQTYVEYLGGDFVLYSYAEIIDEVNIDLPDVMFVYHSYARNQGELDTFANLKSKIILITSGTLRSQIDYEKHFFSSVVYAPITMTKILRILLESKDDISLNTIKTKTFVNIRVLVVEDNIISQTIIANILQNMNIMVTVASNGKEAYQLRKENAFDLIFMDISMPIMNGFEATDKILSYEKKNNEKHVPIIAFSTDTRESDKKKYLKSGMDNLIGKPVHADEIERTLQKYCLDKYIKQ